MCLALLEKGKSFDKIRYADKLNERRTMSVTVKNSRGAVRKRKKEKKARWSRTTWSDVANMGTLSAFNNGVKRKKDG